MRKLITDTHHHDHQPHHLGATTDAKTVKDPVCGMALEPKGVPAAEEGPNPELADFTRRFRVGVAKLAILLGSALAAIAGLRWLEMAGSGRATGQR